MRLGYDIIDWYEREREFERKKYRQTDQTHNNEEKKDRETETHLGNDTESNSEFFL